MTPADLIAAGFRRVLDTPAAAIYHLIDGDIEACVDKHPERWRVPDLERVTMWRRWTATRQQLGLGVGAERVSVMERAE